MKGIKIDDPAFEQKACGAVQYEAWKPEWVYGRPALKTAQQKLMLARQRNICGRVKDHPGVHCANGGDGWIRWRQTRAEVRERNRAYNEYDFDFSL